MFIAFNINHSSILPLMALNSLYCADVPVSNCSLTHSLTHSLVSLGLLLRRRFITRCRSRRVLSTWISICRFWIILSVWIFTSRLFTLSYTTWLPYFTASREKFPSQVIHVELVFTVRLVTVLVSNTFIIRWLHKNINDFRHIIVTFFFEPSYYFRNSAAKQENELHSWWNQKWHKSKALMHCYAALHQCIALEIQFVVRVTNEVRVTARVQWGATVH